jgi:hypothetical protein
MQTITQGHRQLLDVLAQIACQVAMAATKEPHEHVPKDLQSLMRALQHMNASDPLRQSLWIVNSCAPALIFVARHELKPVRLWNIACGDDGLDVEGIDVARITNFGDHTYMWESLEARTPNTMELLIVPQVFRRILDAYEE